MPLERAGLARSVLVFFAGIAAAGMLYGVLNAPFETLVQTSADVSQSSQAAQGRQWITAYWDALPLLVVFLAFLQLLAAAAAERRLPGQ